MKFIASEHLPRNTIIAIDEGCPMGDKSAVVINFESECDSLQARRERERNSMHFQIGIYDLPRVIKHSPVVLVWFALNEDGIVWEYYAEWLKHSQRWAIKQRIAGSSPLSWHWVSEHTFRRLGGESWEKLASHLASTRGVSSFPCEAKAVERAIARLNSEISQGTRELSRQLAKITAKGAERKAEGVVQTLAVAEAAISGARKEAKVLNSRLEGLRERLKEIEKEKEERNKSWHQTVDEILCGCVGKEVSLWVEPRYVVVGDSHGVMITTV